MTRLLAVFSLLLCLLSPAYAGSVHIVLSEDSQSYHRAGDNIQSYLQQQEQSEVGSVTLLTDFKTSQLQPDDLIVTVGKAAAHYFSKSFPDNTQVYSYINKTALPPDPARNWASVVLDQPAQRLLDTAIQTVKDRYRNRIIIAVSEKNTALRQEIDALNIPETATLEVLVIDADDEPAKVIDKALFNAGALIALRDRRIWSGETAKWMLYQSYKYNVPVIGYSKNFIKAGALVSVYANLSQVARSTAEVITGWQNNQGKLTREGVLYPPHSIDYNINIARALKITIPDTISTDEQADAGD